jgi:hypothetical protein
MFKTFNKSLKPYVRAHFVNVFMLGLGEGEGVKPNPNIVRIVMHIGILGRSLTCEPFSSPPPNAFVMHKMLNSSND